MKTIRPYLVSMIDNHKAQGEWKIEIAMRIKFISSLDDNDFRIMHTKSDNVEIISGTETNDVVNERFNSFFKRHQEGSQTKMRGSNFTFDRVDLLYYHLHKISLNRGGSYIYSPEWLKSKRATINPKNDDDDDDECFKYALTVVLNHEEIGNNPPRITEIKPFINNYNWNDIKFPSHSNDWKKFEQNSKSIPLNILFEPYNTKQIRPAYISKYSYKCDNQVVFLMITDNEKWHYLAVKSVSGLLRGITSNYNGHFYCLNCFHSYTTTSKRKKHQRICRDHDFCYVNMPTENNKILKYNPGEESLKVPFIIYADLVCMLRKINAYQVNPTKSYTEKKDA